MARSHYSRADGITVSCSGPRVVEGQGIVLPNLLAAAMHACRTGEMVDARIPTVCPRVWGFVKRIDHLVAADDQAEIEAVSNAQRWQRREQWCGARLVESHPPIK